MKDSYEQLVDKYLLLDDEAVSDQELQDALKWVDMQARKEGLSFYDMVFKILLTYETNKRAKEWLNEKSK